MLFYVWILLLYPLMAAAAAGGGCHVEQNGTRFILKDTAQKCAKYHWRDGETVVANEHQSNTSIVRTWGNYSIFFFSCQKNVRYKSKCTGSIINCSYPCPAESKVTTTSPAKERSPLNLGAVIGGSTAVAIVLCVAVLILATSERLRTYLQAKTAAWCRCGYSAAQ